MADPQSMTGFARESGLLPDGAAFAWELRSVNGRGLDVRLRLPPGLDVLETPLREAVAKRLKRGNVAASLSVKREEKPRLVADPVALDQALRLAMELGTRIPGAAPPRAEALLALPGVLRSEVPAAEDADEAARLDALLAAFARALGGLVAARAGEGRKLGDVLRGLLAEIAMLRDRAASAAVDQPEALRRRLTDQLAGLLGDGAAARVPADRLAQEVALLATRADVREELDRLGAHLEAAAALLVGEGGAGRQLEFLTQEFAREANTLCSKSASIELTQIGLALKAEIERLREQAANLE